ncbi:hypothetical protein IJS77_02820 [bacterium]|nr:hypothetical protein [bacterium]
MNQRWYDKEPTLSLAISLLQNSDIEDRHRCADLIIETAMKNGVVLPNDIKNAIAYLLRRWYDKDEILSQAFEYIKNSDEQLRKKIALSIIEFLQNC